MKKLTWILIAMVAFAASSCNDGKKSTNNADLQNNPLLQEWNTPHNTPPFDKIKNEHYLPAFDEAIRQAYAELEITLADTTEPTFENTIERMERSGAMLSRVAGVFFNLLHAEANDEMQAVAMQIQPKLTKLSNDISLNEELFKRVKTVYEKRESLNLNQEQSKLLEKSYKGFTRSGANLEGEAREKYRELTEKLGKLTLQYQQNTLAETNNYTLNVTDSADLAGLPEGVIEAAAATAKEKGKEGWIFTLQYPSYMPFLKYAENRNLREQLWKAYNRRGANGNANDNREVAKEIANTRLALANVLGYKTFADFVLEEQMAQTPANAINLLNQLLAAAKPYGQKDIAEIQKYAQTQGFEGELMPWDFSMYSEKLKDEKYSVSDEALRPYFKLDNVIDGVFDLTNKLYGLKYTENKDIPVFHSDVKTYDVTDENGKFIAVLYLDFFPRAGKSGGAWMTSFRETSIDESGNEIRPFVSVTCNFTPPTETKPALLTFDEVETYLHEFGHALHGMLAEGTYESLTGTSVLRDFVELPSQIMENYCVEKEFLDMFAKHYETGETIPQSLIDKIIAAQNYNEGYGTLRQLSFGLLDMDYHTITEPITVDVEKIEKKSMTSTQLLPMVDSCLMSTSFGHIFSGGYAAGYYSYKWAEVLDADAFSVFKKNGIFDKATAESFRKNIVSRGGIEHPAVIYKRFRGQEPTIDALLLRAGFKK